MGADTSVDIEIGSAACDGPWPDALWEERLLLLPLMLRERLRRYRRWQDRQLGLLGKLLVLEGLRRRGWDEACLARLEVTPQGRPFLPGGPDFNLSHSGLRAVCAFSRCGQVGVDLEAVRTVRPEDFRLVMSAAQLAEIHRADDPSRRLLQLWTAKESAAKACGIGFGLDFRALHLDGSRLRVAEQAFRVEHFEPAPGYLGCVASECESMRLRVLEYRLQGAGLVETADVSFAAPGEIGR